MNEDDAIDGAGPDPVRLSDGLDRVLASLGAPSSSVLAQLTSEWPDVVGPDVAEHCWIVGVEGDRLIVGVDHPAFATHFRFPDARLREWLGGLGGRGRIRAVEASVRTR